MQGILINLVSLLFQILEILIIVRVILSWVGQNRYNPLVIQVYRITDPLLRPFQGIIPVGNLGMDFSPILAIIVFKLVENFIIQSLTSLF